MAGIAADSLVIYTVTGAAVANNAAVGPIKFADAAGNPAAPFFAEGSRLIGRTIGAAVEVGGVRTYTVRFGPVAAGAAAAPSLQVLAIPESHLLNTMGMDGILVAQPVRGGSRKRRQSKKRRNQRNHNNNQ